MTSRKEVNKSNNKSDNNIFFNILEVDEIKNDDPSKNISHPLYKNNKSASISFDNISEEINLSKISDSLSEIDNILSSIGNKGKLIIINIIILLI